MNHTRTWRDVIFGDIGILVLLALVKLIFHILTNGAHGFHRDELATLNDARYLDWGFVAYPPFTPFVARVALELFGTSLVGFRFFAALSQSIAMVLAGLIARELGGKRHAQILAAVAVAITPVSMSSSAMLMYVAFDYLWWVLLAYLAIRLLKSDDPRWWIGIGAAIGLGMMTKSTMAFYVVGIIVGVLLTSTRKHLTSPWLWGGVALSLLIFLPNIIWQIQHNFISLEFLGSIHERDVRIGRTKDFLPDQLLTTNPFTLPLWIAGLSFYFQGLSSVISSAARNLFLSLRAIFAKQSPFTTWGLLRAKNALAMTEGAHFRMIGWMALVPFALFWLAQGRGYYTGPIYPMLLAAGAVVFERWLAAMSGRRARVATGIAWSLLVIGGVIIALIALPIVPVNSALWATVNDINGEFREQIGWEELTQTVAGIYNALPANEKARAGILAGNYGEAGALNLYGGAYGLPRAISGINSYWLRGYGNPPPETLVVVGADMAYLSSKFESCTLARHITNKYNVLNEETRDHPNIYVCRGMKQSWEEFWKQFRYFG
jgi:4-amino-4-deoxy-L-arabinose transferase-like glycosyltransferase